MLDHILGTFGVDSPEKAFPDQLLRKARVDSRGAADRDVAGNERPRRSAEGQLAPKVIGLVTA